MFNKIASDLSWIFLDLIPNEITRYQVYWRMKEFQHIKVWLRDPILRSRRSRLLSLKNQFSGKRCFIMGNGPSLNITDLCLLEDDYVWGLNRCYLLFDRIKWRPKFFVALDEIVVPDNSYEINSLISELSNCLFFFPLQFRLNGTLASGINTYWYEEIPQNISKIPRGYFSDDAGSYIRAAYTVTIAALQLAVYLGFNPIYLIGCDTDYTLPNSIYFDEKNKDKIISTADDDPNHFRGDYFGAGKKYSRPSPERMIIAYQQAKKIFDEIGIDVFNATIGGKLEVFPRVTYDLLFTKKKKI
jgi:hypothetical protein